MTIGTEPYLQAFRQHKTLSVETLTTIVGHSKPSTYKYIKILQDAGFITKVPGTYPANYTLSLEHEDKINQD